MTFGGAVSFNGDIKDWDISHVRGMCCLFRYAVSFNQPIDEHWDWSHVAETTEMFDWALAYNTHFVVSK
jgi:hypothetical protein